MPGAAPTGVLQEIVGLARSCVELDVERRPPLGSCVHNGISVVGRLRRLLGSWCDVDAMTAQMLALAKKEMYLAC